MTEIDYDYIQYMHGIIYHFIYKDINSEEFENNLMDFIEQKLNENATDIYIQIKICLSDTPNNKDENYICIYMGTNRVVKQNIDIAYNSNIIQNRTNILHKIYNVLSDKLDDLKLNKHYDLPIVDENDLTIRVNIENR